MRPRALPPLSAPLLVFDRSRSRSLLLARLIEGVACWVVLEIFYHGLTVDPWLIRANFSLYLLANVGLWAHYRTAAPSRAVVLLDILVNLLPMGAAAFWSGGINSPLLTVFVLKVGNYGLAFSIEAGLISLATTFLVVGGLWVGARLGLGDAALPLLAQPALIEELRLAFGTILFVLACAYLVRIFREISDRETRLREVATEQERLYRRSLEDQDRLRHLSRRLVEVSEETMRHVSRELHDDLGQALTALRMNLRNLAEQATTHPELQSQLQESREQVGEMLESVRNLSQMLRPPVLDDLGLVAAMQSWTERFSERTGLPVELSLPEIEEIALPQPIELTLYRVLQEALTNVVRHAGASRVEVRLQVSPGQVSLDVQDDGQGFDPPGEGPVEASPGRGIGVLGMQERVEVFGGELQISSRPGDGTRVSLRLPFAAEGDSLQGA